MDWMSPYLWQIEKDLTFRRRHLDVVGGMVAYFQTV